MDFLVWTSIQITDRRARLKRPVGAPSIVVVQVEHRNAARLQLEDIKSDLPWNGK